MRPYISARHRHREGKSGISLTPRGCRKTTAIVFSIILRVSSLKLELHHSLYSSRSSQILRKFSSSDCVQCGHRRAWAARSAFGKGDSIAMRITSGTDCNVIPTLNFETHHRSGEGFKARDSGVRVFKPCDARERHCPPEKEKLHCLIPAPKGYSTPFPWPKSRDYVHYANVPYKSLTIEKAVQNWVQYEGDVFKFPGGGTMFPQGADAYIDELASVIPIADGTVRTALDTGCGVASWGAYLLKRNVLAMSFAPRDSHEALSAVCFRKSVPACLIPWTSNGGMYMIEVDRVLRPGGYWVLSGPPINWKTYYQTWNRSKDELQKEQRRIEELAELLCWEKKYEKGDIAIWRKKINANSCRRKNDLSVKMCKGADADNVWYKKTQLCITPYPVVKSLDEVAGGKLKKFPDRLFSVPPRVSGGSLPGVTVEAYQEDNKLWKKHVNAYKKMNKLISSGRYRNIMDMNAGFGGFAAALESPKLWVMNVVPTISKKNTLGIIYERGLIGIYHDWCEAFSTYPRTYDLIHASGLFSLYQNKCKTEDILLEMDRILRPEGTVILRDDVDVVNKIRKIVSAIYEIGSRGVGI
ncbi:hypothetical protein J5N97_029581 [Dioscorea zingiberensis]|uniref:Methyltransferase n=1 Tax=Dioscorea zingiberensis TaxID=325984 RepID=A0A9D5BW02_9LILI|nr:hypothetical protein J5N97_029581 [Dioscorea zingiberensis]